MCGLVGLLAPAAAEAPLESWSAALRHRGPDDGGVYRGAGIGLAARRLSILDAAGGHQPMSNAAGTVWIAYNGEVLNAPELRAELSALGYAFATRTDTEVVVHAYEAWGAPAVARLRGMFAFALWDAPRRRLVLARDRFGIKPLYYAEAGGRLAFASELRPLFLALPELPRRLAPNALAGLLRWGFAPGSDTLTPGVRALPPAHTLTIENGACRLERYWHLSLPDAGQHRRISAAEAAPEFLGRLRETVAAWRLSDVPVGALLSGGIDSAALAALLTEISGPIDTFTLGFTAASHDETERARATARFLGSRHHELVFAPADFDYLPQAVRHLETPLCSATSVPIYLLYRACHAAGYKVILTGEGADELLGGYHWFAGDARARPLLGLPRAVRALLARLPGPASAAARRVIAHGERDPARRYARWQQVAEAGQITQLLGAAFEAPADLAAPAGRHPFDQFLWLEAHTRLPGLINWEVDRMSMAHSVEARPPFLDHTLWEYCAALPPALKRGPRGEKTLLRDALRGLIPDTVRRRPKHGLAAPHAAWFRAARLPAWAEDCLHPSALAETGYFQGAAVRRLRAQHQAGRANHARLLLGVLTTQLWHAEFAPA